MILRHTIRPVAKGHFLGRVLRDKKSWPNRAGPNPVLAEDGAAAGLSICLTTVSISANDVMRSNTK
ncbi:hypothetical protein SKA53_08066 [Yoonia vestfoldensis SKA53]|uniref:Uncharacterized protein n=1 Tax=Yoonia vestfoldensis SKA53 TaxID=314232 RepID=A3V729_9RHOB|nr:hypothetical protein SKA53_08066 [Yoonia vestfoldensis SKA53]